MASPVQSDSSESSTSTPEYLAFQANYEPLIEAVKAQPDNFCNALFAKAYIPTSVRDHTRTLGVSNEVKAYKLVDTVIDQIKQYPGVFHGFIDMPINQTNFMVPVIQKVKRNYEVELMKQNHKNIPSSTLTEGYQVPAEKQAM